MIKTVSIPTFDHEGGLIDYKVRATAIRLPEQDGWHILFSALGEDTWLAVMEFLDLPKEVKLHPASARYYANLTLLLGDPWQAFWEDAETTVRQQHTALGKVGPTTEARLHASDPEDTIAWRAQFEAQPIERGEIIRRDLTGIDPFAGRN